MKKANKLFTCCLMAVAAAVLSSCGILSSPKYQETAFYDFGLPHRMTPDYNVNVNLFSGGNSNYGRQRMLYRYEGNRVDNDEYNRWAATPNRLVSSYIRLAFAQKSAATSKDKPTFTISGVLLACEADVAKKEVVLSVAYEITSSNMLEVKYNSSAVIRVKMDKVTPDNYASAMSKAADQLVATLKKEMDELYEKEKSSVKDADAKSTIAEKSSDEAVPVKEAEKQ